MSVNFERFMKIKEVGHKQNYWHMYIITLSDSTVALQVVTAICVATEENLVTSSKIGTKFSIFFKT